MRMAEARIGGVGHRGAEKTLLARLEPDLYPGVKRLHEIGPVVAEKVRVQRVAAFDLRIADEFIGRSQALDHIPIDRQRIARVDSLPLVALIDPPKRAELPAGRRPHDARYEATILKGVEFDAIKDE